MAREKKEKKKDKKEKKGRISKKGRALLNKELEKIESAKRSEMESMLSLSRGDRKQKKVAEKFRKKVIEYFERKTLLVGVANMNMDLVKGSPEKIAAREALIAAKAQEEEVKNMDWKELMEKFGDMTFEKNNDDDFSDEELNEEAC